MTDNILVIGAGAIGGFYGALLAKAGAAVSVVCRSDYQIAKTDGFAIDSYDLGQWRFKPRQVLRDCRDYGEKADYLILCTKVTTQLNRVDLIRPAVSNGTKIVFIQNGVDIEAELLQAFPDNEIISGLAFVCCNRVAPAAISHIAYGKLTLGNVPKGVSEHTRHLQSLFLKAGIDCETSDDIVSSRWQKCIWNAPFNPLSVLSGGLPTLDILKSQETLVRRIMQEVYRIAAGSGHSLPEDIVDSNIQKTWVMPPYKTSMLLDLERCRPLETEAIIGNAVRCAHRHNIDCPALETIYALLQLRELEISRYHQEKS